MRDNSEIINRLFKILCSYKQQPIELKDFLQSGMKGQYYPEREVLYREDSIVTDAIFVSSGFVACYGFDANGDRQVVSIYGKDSIIAGKSFTSGQPSSYEWTALAGAYLMKVGRSQMEEVYSRFPDSEELARLVMADVADRELERLRMLKRDAESVIYDFYKKDFGEFYPPGKLMVDADVASFLLLSESTLRNVRARLVRGNRLP